MKNEFELHLYKSEYNEYLAIKRNNEDQVINCYMDPIKFIHNIDFETLSIVLTKYDTFVDYTNMLNRFFHGWRCSNSHKEKWNSENGIP